MRSGVVGGLAAVVALLLLPSLVYGSHGPVSIASGSGTATWSGTDPVPVDFGSVSIVAGGDFASEVVVTFDGPVILQVLCDGSPWQSSEIAAESSPYTQSVGWGGAPGGSDCHWRVYANGGPGGDVDVSWEAFEWSHTDYVPPPAPTPLAVEIVGYGHDLHVLVGEAHDRAIVVAFVGLFAAGLNVLLLAVIAVAVAFRR